MRRPASDTRSSTSRRLGLLLAVLVGLLLALYAAAYVAAGDGIARGTTVLGVSIAGQSPAEAARTLRQELRNESAMPLPVLAGETRAEVDPLRSGLSLDAEATARAAPARSWNPVDLVRGLLGDDRVEPVVAVDRDALRRGVERVAEVADRPAVQGSVEIRGLTVVGVDPQEGVRVAQEQSADVLRRAYLSADHVRGGPPVELPVEVERPSIDQAEVDRVVGEVAEPALAGPVLVTVEGLTVQVGPRAIARSLSFRPVDPAGDRLEPQLDAQRLHASVADELAAVEDPARDATFRIVGGRPRVVPAERGREVLPQMLADAVLPVLPATGSERTAEAPLSVTQPEVTTAEARALGVDELVATYTTYYPSDFAPRLTNIHRAADFMDGTLVLPGETFSFNGTVGERTAARGFAAGFIINNGQLEVDYGGGVSQLATTAFNAFFFAGLEIVEHNPHSFYISRYPEGRESTIAWGYKDLRARNDSPNGIFITTGYTNSSVTVTIWGTKRYTIEATKSARYDITPFRVVRDPRPAGTDQGDCVATEGVPGFRVIVNRLFYRGGEQVKSEEFRTRYEPEPEVICGSSAAPADDS